MAGKIFINGLIGSIDDERGIELIDVVQQVRSQPEATEFEVHLTETPGGVVEVGDDIYNYLVSLNAETPVTTIAKGLCASISTKIFMAGSKRVIYEGCEFMIHLPMLSAQYLNSNELEEATDEMKKLDQEMVKFYSDSTGTSKEAIYPLMRNETYLTPEQAVNLGFATEVKTPLKAVAYLNNSKTKKEMSETKLSTEDKNWITTQIEALSKKFFSSKTTKETSETKKVNLVLQDENGVEVNFTELEDGATPSVGDVATVDGAPAEGSYIMPQLGNVTAVFAEGVLTELIDPEEEESEEMKALREENERLESEVTRLSTAFDDQEESMKELQKNFLNFKKQTNSKFNLEVENPKPEDPKDEPVNYAKNALNKLIEKRNK